MHCAACGKDDLVAFACKRRGFCPSCGARRMVDTAAHLVDRVLPEVRVRQWVLALPDRVRFLCAIDPALCSAVRRVVVRAISSWYRGRAKRRGIAEPRTGCVTFIQRFDSALRMNVHFHMLWPDGAFSIELQDDKARDRAGFHDIEPPNDDDIAGLVKTLRDRVLRLLRKRGKLPPEDDEGTDAPGCEQPSLFEGLAAASVQGKIALGPHAGALAPRLGRGTAHEPRSRGKLCASCDGFSLNAAVRVPEFSPERLEKLCRYVARPAVVHERLSLSKDGKKVLYKLKKRYRDGSTHVVLDPLDFIARLAALIPRPRVHLVTYHGVFAPAAAHRDLVVPDPPEEDDQSTCAHRAKPKGNDDRPPPRPRGRRRYSWAELMRRVFRIDVLICQRCGGPRKVLDLLTDPAVLDRILRHLGLPADAPVVAPARAPPEASLPFE